MPSIIDAFVVTLGLDTRGWKKGEAELEAGNKKLRQGAKGTADEIEAHGKQMGRFFSGLRQEIVGLSLAVAGAVGLKDFVGQIIGGDAATGRLARNLGLATVELSAWEGALTRVGGKAEDADAALQSMVQAAQSYKLTGTTGHDADFQGLGVTLADLQDPAKALLQIAKAGERLSRPEFTARLGRLGFNDSTITLLAKGRRGVEDLLAEQRKLGVVTDDDAAAAIRLESAWAALSSRIKGDARPAITGLLQDLLHLTSAVEKFEASGGLNKFVGDVDKRVPLLGAIDELFGMGGGKPWWQKLWDGDFEKGGASAGGGPDRSNPSIVFTDKNGQPIARPGGARGRAVALAGNNPGGINNGAFAAAQPGYTGANGRYAAFDTLQHGEDAQRALLASYLRQGYRTPAAIARRWAPVGDGKNDPAAYAQSIADAMGIGVNDVIRPEDIGRFAHAQAKRENSGYSGTLRGIRMMSLREFGQRAAAGGDVTSSTNIGTIIVHTAATDGHAIARDLPAAIKRRQLVTQANSGPSG